MPPVLKACVGRGGEPYSCDSEWGRRILAFLTRLASADVPVLITGETGVGKEVLARAIHNRSSRAKAPFVKLNCAALPSELIESELFGYERGAFTGAARTTPGLFETAENGTILLDEIGDMDLRLQAKLLQVLQDSQFLRVGGRQQISVNVRVIAATHRDLPNAVQKDLFRQDLYYRLNVVSIQIPPLRERPDEIVPLAEHFRLCYSDPSESSVAFPASLLQAFLKHSWPGNVRELENTVRRFLVMREPEPLIAEIDRSQERVCPRADSASATGLEFSPIPGKPPTLLEGASTVEGFLNRDIPEAVSRCTGTRKPLGTLSLVDQQFRRAETEAILQALNSTLWNRREAADLLNVDYKALLYKMKKLGLARRARA